MRRFFKNFTSHTRALFLCLGTLFLLHLFSGCGGGLSGTGDLDESQIQGNLRSVTGAAFAGAIITVLETGDSAVSDSLGDFLIVTALSSPDLNLSVKGGAVDATVFVGTFPDGIQNLRLVLEVNEALNTVTVVSNQVTPIPTATPRSDDDGSSSDGGSDKPGTRTPTPVPSATQPAGAGPAPTTPSAQATPTAAPTATPTPTVAAQQATYSGVVQLITDQSGLSGAVVTLVETGISDVTGNDGAFSFQTTRGLFNIKVTYQGKSASGRIPASALAGGSDFVNLKIILTFDNPAAPSDFSIAVLPANLDVS